MLTPGFRGGAVVVVSATAFGLMPIFARYAYDAGLNVPTLLLLRFTLAAAVLLGYLAWRGFPRLSRRDVGSLLLLGAVLYALQSLLYFSAVEHISPALAVLLLYLYPAIVLVISAVVDRAAPSLAGVLAIAVSLGGMALVVGGPTGRQSLVGVAYAIGAAVVYAVYITVGNRVSVRVPPTSATAFVALFAALSFLGTGSLTGSLDFDFRPVGWLSVLGVALVSTVLAIACFFAGMKVVGPTRASIVSMVEPVVSIVAAAVLLGSTMSPIQLLGGVLVIAGAVWGVVAPAHGSRAEPKSSRAEGKSARAERKCSRAEPTAGPADATRAR